MNVFIHLSFILMTTTSVHASECRNYLDIVVAVDTTSSQAVSSFGDVKAEVKGIVAGFTVRKHHTRLALISISKQAQFVVNFDGVNSVSDFNAAVDKLSFSTDTVDLSEGLKAAKDYFLISSTKSVRKVLVLVKDRRSVNAAESDASVLSRMTSEAAVMKTSGVAIHAVGVGGLWNLLELHALYGTDYLLFKNKNKALESTKSMNNVVCDPNCPRKGMSVQKSGQCIKSMNHTISTRVAVEVDSKGISVCRTEIERDFLPCTETTVHKCHEVDRVVGSCDASDNTLKIENSWQYFDIKQQSCVKRTQTNTVACADVKKCPGQMADVIFVLDKSGSIDDQFPHIKSATLELVGSLNVGPDNVRVGVTKFGSDVEQIIEFGSVLAEADVMRILNEMTSIVGGATMTNLGLKDARIAFSNRGRPNVPKFVFVMTDGGSTYPEETVAETRLLKQSGATVYAIGVGSISRSELEMIASPEIGTNLFIFQHFNDLKKWSDSFSKRLCIQLTAPNSLFCDNSVFIQTVSECVRGEQQQIRSEYNYDSAKRCIKSNQMSTNRNCAEKCTDPIDGNEYLSGSSWSRLCHDFACSSGLTFSPNKKCLAADGTCKEVNSQPFKCLDEAGTETENCQCVNKSGKAVIVIDRM